MSDFCVIRQVHDLHDRQFQVDVFIGIVDLAIVVNFFDRHFVLSQCTGFVGTDNFSTTQCFNSRQFTDKCISARHFLRTQRQDDRRDGRQTFRNSRNGYGNRNHQHIQPRTAIESESDDEHQYSDDQNQNRQRFTHLILVDL